jgi:hypothetical protein
MIKSVRIGEVEDLITRGKTLFERYITVVYPE